jgi:rhodanese-related sulfurtransferase
MGIFNFLFEGREKKIKHYLSKGAIILDVRTEREYNMEAIEGAKHIPLNQLREHVSGLKKHNKPFIIYCASGIRSAQATKYLNLEDIDAINGGGMKALKRMLGHQD